MGGMNEGHRDAFRYTEDHCQPRQLARLLTATQSQRWQRTVKCPHQVDPTKGTDKFPHNQMERSLSTDGEKLEQSFKLLI